MYGTVVAVDQEDVSAEWTFNAGGVSKRESDFCGVLVSSGDAGEDDDEVFNLQPVSKAQEKQPLEEEEEEGISAEWTFNAGGVSKRESDFCGVLVSSGDAGEDDDEDFNLQPVSKAEEKNPEPTPEPLPKKKRQSFSKKLRESFSKKLRGSFTSNSTVSTYRDSFSSRVDSDPSLLDSAELMSPKRESKKKKKSKKGESSEKKLKKKKSKKSEKGESAPLSPKRPKARPGLQGPTLSPMDKAKMRVSSRHLLNSARTQRKANAKMSLNLLAFKTLDLDEE